MPITDDAELPIQTIQVDGPAVRANATRLQENHFPRVEVTQFRAAAAATEEKTLQGLATLASVSY
jgi:hypothetical protein